MKKRILIVLSLLIFITVFKSIKSDDVEEYSTSLFAMNTYITLELYGENAKETAKILSNKINYFENLWSTTLNTSEIYKINSSNGTPAKVSDETADIINYSINMADKTFGSLNLAIYPLVKEWGFTTGNYRIPAKNDIDSLLKHTDYKKIKLENNEVLIAKNMKIDLGSIGKGYTSDVVAEIAKNNGISSGLVNLGGNVQAIGTKPNGEKWKLGLQNPFGEGNIGILEIADCAVITSGNYEKYFIGEDGKQYCHIINPLTGYPVDNELTSVTVIGNEGKMCDALSTALFVMGKDKTIEFWKLNKNFELILITKDKNVYITSGLKNSFNITDRALTVINID